MTATFQSGRADVAVVCTHSDVAGLQRIGRQFAPEVIDVYGELIAANPRRVRGG